MIFGFFTFLTKIFRVPDFRRSLKICEKTHFLESDETNAAAKKNLKPTKIDLVLPKIELVLPKIKLVITKINPLPTSAQLEANRIN